ncbi:MAG: 3-isopropylmalate dehydratase small subunit [Planctomycetota bacterium]
MDYGFRVVLAPSFADIFFNNCFKNGILPIRLSETRIDYLFHKTNATEGYELTVDLESQKITGPEGLSIPFEVDPFRRDCLLRGLDDIGLTLQHEAEISAYEKAHPSFK